MKCTFFPLNNLKKESAGYFWPRRICKFEKILHTYIDENNDLRKPAIDFSCLGGNNIQMEDSPHEGMVPGLTFVSNY